MAIRNTFCTQHLYLKIWIVRAQYRYHRNSPTKGVPRCLDCVQMRNRGAIWVSIVKKFQLLRRPRERPRGEFSREPDREGGRRCERFCIFVSTIKPMASSH